MIFIGPEEETTEKPLEMPESLRMSAILHHVAAELDDLGGLLSRLETSLLPTPGTPAHHQDRHTLQSIDLLGQSLQALSTFLHRLSQDCDSWAVPVAAPLAEIPLADLRKRLARAEPVLANQPRA